MDSITDESPDMIHEPDDLSDRGEIGPTIDLNIGGKIEVYWPLDIEYYPGTVTTYDGATGFHGINYDDGDHESLDMDKETWRVLQSSRSNCVDLSSVHKEALEAYYKSFAHKEFMIHQAEGLPPHPVWNAYKEEESKFMKTVREVSIDKVPKDSNVITSHVIYKVKANDNGSLKMKARIAPHGNKDKDRFELKTDSAQCPPTGIRILASVSTIMKWPIAKIDFASAFLQTGDAKRDVYVIPPRECRRRSNYWLLLTSAYGLVNANAKWQEHCDYLFSSLGLLQSRYVPQLFFSKGKGLEILAVKIVDDVLITGSRINIENFIAQVQSKYELGTVVYGPGQFLFFGLQLEQDSNMTVTIHGDAKLQAICCSSLSRHRRKMMTEDLNEIELRSFRSVNSSKGWLGTHAPIFCAFILAGCSKKL